MISRRIRQDRLDNLWLCLRVFALKSHYLKAPAVHRPALLVQQYRTLRTRVARLLVCLSELKAQVCLSLSFPRDKSQPRQTIQKHCHEQ